MANSVDSDSVITIDGPSGSGKGTVCRILANKLGFHLLDSGAIYRLAALSAIRHNLALDDEVGLVSMAERLEIEFVADQNGTTVLLENDDVSAAIRSEQVGMTASKIAPLAGLRAALLDRQRAFAQPPGLVADGRDMGTVVFPTAKNKFFLTASAEERARRRILQLEQSGAGEHDYDAVLSDIKARDDRDTNRAAAPLKPSKDACLIDSSELSIEAVVAKMLAKIQS